MYYKLRRYFHFVMVCSPNIIWVFKAGTMKRGCVHGTQWEERNVYNVL